jgi:hypothetical protein
MSLLSNPNAIRMGIYSTWSSVWYENNTVYSTLIYTDLYINEFLNGIYYKLKMPTTLPTIREIGYDQILITTKSFVFFKGKRAMIRKVMDYMCSIKFRHRRVLFFLRRALRKIKLFSYYNRNINSIKNKLNSNNKYITLNKFKKMLYKKKNKRRRLIIIKRKKNNKKYVSFIKNVRYKIREREKRFWEMKKYFYKLMLHIKENDKMDKMKKAVSSFSNINKQIKKNLIYRNKRKNQVFNYRKNVKGHLKFKLNKKTRRLSRKRAMLRKLSFKKKKLNIRSKKYKHRVNIKQINNKLLVKNKNVILFNWLVMKINQWFFLLILKSMITFNLIIGKERQELFNKNRQTKLNNKQFIFDLKNKNKNRLDINKNTNDLVLSMKRIKYILSCLENINNLDVVSFYPFRKEIGIDKLNLRDKLFHYMRIKSYYRRKKRMNRYNKMKELSLGFPPKFYTLNVSLFKTTKKWVWLFYKDLCYNQLHLKIKETLSKYLYKPILYFPSYKRGNYPILNNPKMLGDYIKLLMTYEQRNPTILRKVVMDHSKQKKRQRKKSYNLIRKLNNLKRRIIIKLRKHKKLINLPFIFRTKIKRKIRSYRKKTSFNDKKSNVSIFKLMMNNKKYNRSYFKRYLKKQKKNKLININKDRSIDVNNLNNFSKLSNLRRNIVLCKLKKIKNKKMMNTFLNSNYKRDKKVRFFKKKKVKKNMFSNINKRMNNFAKNKKLSYKKQMLLNKKIAYFKKKNAEINKQKKNQRKKRKLMSIYNYKRNTIKGHLNKLNRTNNDLNMKKNRISLLYNLKDWRFRFRDLSYKRYPLIGMRIECSGPTKKGRRTQTHLYNEWVDFYTLPGKMPLVTVMNDIKYWQTYGLTRRAAIGIKIWMHFHPSTYSQGKKRLINKN